MSRKTWLLLAAGALVLLLAGRMVLRYLDFEASEQLASIPRALAGVPRLSAAAAGIEDVERASVISCMCRRKGGTEAECNAIYTKARDTMLMRVHGEIPTSPPGEEFAMCAPISSRFECFEFADGNRCITTHYSVVAGSSEAALDEVCTEQEAQAVEEAVAKAWRGPDGSAPEPGDDAAWDAANRRTMAAIDDVLRRIKAGEQVATAGRDSEGCTG